MVSGCRQGDPRRLGVRRHAGVEAAGLSLPVRIGPKFRIKGEKTRSVTHPSLAPMRIRLSDIQACTEDPLQAADALDSKYDGEERL